MPRPLSGRMLHPGQGRRVNAAVTMPRARDNLQSAMLRRMLFLLIVCLIVSLPLLCAGARRRQWQFSRASSEATLPTLRSGTVRISPTLAGRVAGGVLLRKSTGSATAYREITVRGGHVRRLHVHLPARAFVGEQC